MTTTHATTPPLSLGDLGTRLQSLLESLTALYTRLLEAATAHGGAMRRADARGMELALAQQAEVLQLIGERERERQSLVNAAAAVVCLPRTNHAITLSDLVQHLPEPLRSVLLALADSLRTLMREAQSRHAALKAAAGGLASHMEGLIRHIGRQLSHAGTYSRRGHVESHSPVTTLLDLKS